MARTERFGKLYIHNERVVVQSIFIFICVTFILKLIGIDFNDYYDLLKKYLSKIWNRCVVTKTQTNYREKFQFFVMKYLRHKFLNSYCRKVSAINIHINKFFILNFQFLFIYSSKDGTIYFYYLKYQKSCLITII